MARNADSLRFHLEMDMDAGREAVKGFAERMERDPVDAFEWADPVIEKIAKARVATILAAILDERGFGPGLERRAREEALRGARWPASSTSPTSNRMNQAVTAAWANYAELLAEGTN